MTFDLPAVHLKRGFNSFELEGVNSRKQVPLGENDSLQAMEGCTGRKSPPTPLLPSPRTTTTTYHVSFWTLRPVDSSDALRNHKLPLATTSDSRQQQMMSMTGTYGRTRRSRGSAWSEQTSGTLQRSKIN